MYMCIKTLFQAYNQSLVILELGVKLVKSDIFDRITRVPGQAYIVTENKVHLKVKWSSGKCVER